MDELEFMLRLIGLVTGPVFLLIGVFLGGRLTKKTQEKMLKVQEIRNELEKAYGTLYSILSKPEKMVKVDEGNELRAVVSRQEKKELDRILMSYPHMFPPEIVGLWRKEIRDLQPYEILVEWVEPTEFSFGIPVEFKDKIREEYYKRLQEYYKITGREKSLKRLPKWARP